jgi:hypothetical protein
MTQEEKDRISSQRGMVMPNQLDSGLGMQGVPAFPANFSNIGPSEQKAGPTRFDSGVPATIGIGGINSAYASPLGLSGAAFGSTQSGSAIGGLNLSETGSRDFGSVGLFQPQAFGGGGLERRENTIMDQPFSFTNNASGGLANEGYNFNQPSRNAFSLPLQTSIPINGDRISMRIDQTQAQMAAQQGKTAIQTPYGTMFATEQQAINSQTPRTAAQSSSRTPQQQQELLAQMRERGGVIGKRLAGEEANRQKDLQGKYYAFREESERGRAEEALSTERGRSPDKARGAEALIQAERFRQAQQGRSPMSRSPLVFGASAPQPAASFSASPSMGGPSTMRGGGSPFSFTPFSQKMENQANSSLMGFSSEVGKPLNVPKSKSLRPYRLPFGMRPFGS